MTNTTDSKSMSKSHVIRVPGELVEGWVSGIWHEGTPVRVAASDRYIADKAAQWGWDQREPEIQERADQMLDACCFEIIDGVGRLFIDETKFREHLVDHLRAAMRPRPPSLAGQGIEALGAVVDVLQLGFPGANIDGVHIQTLTAALNRLAELENQQ
jgi:hypothetical protein